MVSMENALSPLNPMASSTPMAPDGQETHFQPFYYSLVAIALTALVLIAYNIVVVGWCWRHQARRRPDQSPDTRETSRRTAVGQSIPISKYRKEDNSLQACSECAVCLSVFLDGEELRKLPKCNHSFHAACIDMWLYSHSNCPLCRQAVAVPRSSRPSQEESQSQQHLPV